MSSSINASTGNGIVGRLLKSADSSGILSLQTNTTNALTIDANQNPTCNSTGAITVSSGTTGNRPTGVNGMIRYNTTTSQLEGYIAGAWVSLI
jgi:hypothetical protein